MPTSTISYLWRDPGAAHSYQTGVSLHSHTNQSKETLDFVTAWGAQFPVVRPLLERFQRKSEENDRIPLNFPAAYWTPPLTPKLAYDLDSPPMIPPGSLLHFEVELLSVAPPAPPAAGAPQGHPPIPPPQPK